MKTLIDSVAAKLLALLRNEPAIVIGFIAAVVVGVAGAFHVILHKDAVEQVLVPLVPLVTALITRFFVTPNAKIAAK